MPSETRPFSNAQPIAQREHARAASVRDDVDEAAWQSFPASDPPAHRVEHGASTRMQRRREAASHAVRRVQIKVRRELQERPWPTLLAVTGAGIALGVLSRPARALSFGRLAYRIARKTAARASVVALRNALQPRIQRVLPAASLAGGSRMESEPHETSPSDRGGTEMGSSVRQVAPQIVGEASEKVEQAGSAIAQRAHSAGRQLQRTDFKALGRELTQWVREHPALSLGVGLGCGVLIGRAMAR